MKALKVGYIFVITTLVVLTITLGVAAFYPAPRRDYTPPTYQTSSGVVDYNSPEYKQQQKVYDEQMKKYNDQTKGIDDARKIWGQNALIIALIYLGKPKIKLCNVSKLIFFHSSCIAFINSCFNLGEKIFFHINCNHRYKACIKLCTGRIFTN